MQCTGDIGSAHFLGRTGENRRRWGGVNAGIRRPRYEVKSISCKLVLVHVYSLLSLIPRHVSWE